MSATLGRKVEIEMPGSTKVVSVAASIDASGALVLEDGRLIMVGDVVHVSTL
jgi:biotin-(acetyl-CoA carboxylase) ligase